MHCAPSAILVYHEILSATVHAKRLAGKKGVRQANGRRGRLIDEKQDSVKWKFNLIYIIIFINSGNHRKKKGIVITEGGKIGEGRVRVREAEPSRDRQGNNTVTASSCQLVFYCVVSCEREHWLATEPWRERLLRLTVWVWWRQKIASEHRRVASVLCLSTKTKIVAGNIDQEEQRGMKR